MSRDGINYALRVAKSPPIRVIQPLSNHPINGIFHANTSEEVITVFAIRSRLLGIVVVAIIAAATSSSLALADGIQPPPGTTDISAWKHSVDPSPAPVSGGGVVPMTGYGDKTLDGPFQCSSVNSAACTSFETQLHSWADIFPPEDHVRLTSGVSSPRWYGSTPYDPYAIFLYGNFGCSGIDISLSLPLGIGASTSGTSATFTWPGVYGNWGPDSYYPYNAVTCQGFELHNFTQTDDAYIQLYSSQSAILVVTSGSELIGAF